MAYTTKYYTADTHFGHSLMLDPRACGRPFASTHEMDDYLIDRWNSVVRPDDLVFHLGDFAFGLGDEQRVRSVFRQLNGRKRLILGNHDIGKKGRLHPVIESLGWDEPPVAAVETVDEGQRVYLHHYACRTWPGSHKGAWHFYGHSHGKLSGVGRSRDVGVDCPDTAFTPRTFRQLTAGIVAAEQGAAA